jgi:hypothetical protein
MRLSGNRYQESMDVVQCSDGRHQQKANLAIHKIATSQRVAGHLIVMMGSRDAIGS